MGITLVVMLVPFGLYLLLYVSSKEAYFVNRSHRSLARIGRQISSRIESLQEVILNVGKEDCDGGGEDPIRKLFNHKTLSPFGVQLTFDRITGQAEQYEKQTKRKSAEAASLNVKSTLAEPYEKQAKPKPAKPELTLAFKRKGATTQVVFEYQTSRTEKKSREPFSVTIDTEQLLQPVVERFLIHDRESGDEEIFDKVLVADSESGDVVFDHGLESFTVSNLDEISPAHSSSADRKSAESSSVEHPEEGTESDKNKNDRAKANRVWRGLSAMSRITIADTDYRLFYQPIRLSVPKTVGGGEQGSGLSVCGLVSSDHLTKKSRSFSYTVLLAAILVVLMTTASGPLIKLRLLGPKDRLRKSDAVQTACSLFLVLAILTVTLLDAYTYATLENDLDDQLESLANTIDSNLRTELARAIDQLDALNGKLGEDLSVAYEERVCAAKSVEPGTTEASEDQSALTTKYFKENILRDDGILDPQSAPYPYFNSAIWSDLSGEQQIKFTTRRRHTPFIKVSKRQFFNNAKDGKVWTLTVDEDPQAPPRKLSLEVLTSRTSGENVAVISELTPDKAYVAALDTRLLSLYQTVLPAGFGFCIIDSAGLVLFHTDDVKNLEENFFEECNDDRTLRSAALSREREWATVPYLGRDHRAFVTPIKDLPLTVAVFRDKHILRTINLQIVTLVAVALMGYVLLLALATAVFRFAGSELPPIIMWPCPKLARLYAQAAVANSALFVICVVLVLLSSRATLILWALLFPALGIAYTFVLFRKKPGEHLSERRMWRVFEDWRRSYSLALLSLLVLLCVAPAFAFFKLIRDEQVKVFIRYGQMSLARSLEQRESQVWEQYASGDPQVDVGPDKDQFVKARLTSDWDVYDSFFFGTTREKGNAIDERPVYGVVGWFLTTFSPFYDETCVESLRLARGQSSDARWTSSEQQRNLTLSLHPVMTNVKRLDAATAADQQHGSDSYALGFAANDQPAEETTRGHEEQEPANWKLTSTLPKFANIANHFSWALVAAVALMFAAAHFALRFAARRIFLLDVAKPVAIAAPLADPVDKNYLIIGSPSFDHEYLFPSGRFLHIDLGRTSAEEWWKSETRLETAPRDLPVVVDRFETNNDDAAWNERKLQFVEGLISKESRHVLVVSSVDPVDFPLSNRKQSGVELEPSSQASLKNKPVVVAGGAALKPIANMDSRPDVERWSAVLRSFVRVNASEQPGLNTRLGLKREPIGAKPGADYEELIAQTGDQAETFYRGVWSTCSPKQKLTLFRVAQDGLVSRLDPDLRWLMQRGLILRDPSLRLIDPSFRRFVLRISAAEGIDRHRSQTESHWERFKAPLLLLLLAVIAFLLLTQKELFDTTLSMVSALTGGAIAVLKLVGIFQKGKGTSAADS